MKAEEIEQNAKEYAKKHYDIPFEDNSSMNVIVSEESYIAGAHSRDEEIEILKDLFSNSQRYVHSLKESVKSMGEQLKNAVSMLKDIYEDDDYFCTRLLDIPEEEKICEIYCDKEGVQCDCILRYLKHYKKEN